jgi:four helix bundle protein
MDQLIRAGVSIGANMTEARAASSKKDCINFYSYALKSANEAKYWPAMLKESKKISSKINNSLIDEVVQLANLLAASILTMKKKRIY